MTEARDRSPIAASPMIPYGRQLLDEQDVQAVVDVLRGGWLTTGPSVDAFEAALAQRVGAAGAVVVNSGTAALHAAYYAAGLGPGSELVTSPLTFVATASAAVQLGADVRFCDIEASYGTLDPAKLAAVTCERTRVVAPVDFAGHPADYAALGDVAAACQAASKVTIVADAAHSLGAQRGGVPVGKLAHATATSFHPVKPITTAEGGAVFSDDAVWLERARRFRNHGIERDPKCAWHYEIADFGLNYRMPDLLCALGLSQLHKLDTFIARRSAIAAHYADALAEIDALELPSVAPDASSGWHLYVVRVRDASLRNPFMARLRELGVGVQLHYPPAHLHPVFRKRGYGPGQFPVAEDWCARSLSLPVFPGLSDSDLGSVVDRVHSAAAELLS